MINVALIGNGYWGKNYNKTLQNIENINVNTYTHNYKDALNNKSIDCVIIATPVETHYQIIKDSLIAKKHVLVEKPFITDSKNTVELKKLAFDNSLILQVGHIYLYHEGILQLKKLVDEGSLGEIKSVYSKRMSTYNKYPNALWEMGSHDLYILDYLFDKYVAKEKQIMGDITHCIFNMEYSKILYEPYIRNHVINAYVEVCSYYPGKIREIIINGTKKRVMFKNDEEIVITELETNKSNFLIYNDDKSRIITPLEKQCTEFFDNFKNFAKPKSGIFEGFKNIVYLELLNKML